MSGAIKRMIKEIDDMKKTPDLFCSAEPIGDNILHLKGNIIGPDSSPYANGKFILDIVIPKNYPYEPPKISFVTRIFHPNISEYGKICLDILGHEWSPALTVAKLLLSISSLLNEPNPNDPLDSHVANIYKNDYQKFLNIAKEWTQKYAI